MPKSLEENEKTDEEADTDENYGGDDDSGEETFQKSSAYEFAGDEDEDEFGEDW